MTQTVPDVGQGCNLSLGRGHGLCVGCSAHIYFLCAAQTGNIRHGFSRDLEGNSVQGSVEDKRWLSVRSLICRAWPNRIVLQRGRHMRRLEISLEAPQTEYCSERIPAGTRPQSESLGSHGKEATVFAELSFRFCGDSWYAVLLRHMRRMRCQGAACDSLGSAEESLQLASSPRNTANAEG